MSAGAEIEGGMGGIVRQASIVALLVGALILLHHFTVPQETGFDPTAMLAFGFIVLGSYTVGQLVEAMKLPHITGYIVAGVVFGPSIPQFLPAELRVPPFDRGILNEQVLEQLGLLDALAVALIALTAGGELKIETVRRGLRAILSIMFSQLFVVGLTVTAFVWFVSGHGPFGFVLPGLSGISPMAAIAMGTTVAAVSAATSPAATIAVINGLRAEGPMTRTVLSTVVFNDVLIVVAFSVASTFAARALGVSVAGEALASVLLTHVGGSLVVGAALGAMISLYLRYFGQELLLFLVAMIYTATYLARELHLDPILMFLTAGFTASNFSSAGDRMIHSVERLSLPVYVVFFTLAGARLHLDELIALAPFAASLVALRIVAIRLGFFVGARVGRTDETVRRYGWMGFVSQAGINLSLAAIIAANFGEAGRALSTLLVAGIAVNELAGPVLLKLGLFRAGELPTARASSSDDFFAPPLPPERPRRSTPDPEPSSPVSSSDATVETDQVWGPPIRSSSRAIEARLLDLQSDLQFVVRDVENGPLAELRKETEVYLRELRREFLRHHRRLVVHWRSEGDRSTLAARLRGEQAELAERWRLLVLGRAARLRQGGWTPGALVEAIDRVVDSLPEQVDAPVEPTSYLGPPPGGKSRGLRRTWLKTRRGARKLFGLGPVVRKVELRTLGRYHLSGQAPARLEALAELLVESEQQLAARTRNLFHTLSRESDALAERMTDPELDPAVELGRVKDELEKELALALDEVVRTVRDGAQRTSSALGEGLRAIKQDVAIYGTFDLPTRRRRSSRIFRKRNQAIESIAAALQRVRRASATGYSFLALELELVGLEARAKELLAEHVGRIESDVRGRSFVQLERVREALTNAMAEMEETLSSEATAEAVAVSMRRIAEGVDKVASDAARAALQLRERLSEESAVAPLLDAFGRTGRTLTDRYEVSAGRQSHVDWKVPASVGVVDVPFRELVTTWIDTRIAPKLLAALREMAAKAQPLAASLSELERLVAFNIELATSEIELAPDEPVPVATRSLLKEMVGGVLERSLATVQGHADTVARWPDELGQAIRDGVLGGLGELREQLVAEEISKSRIEGMRRTAAGRRLIREAERLPSLLTRFREEAERTVRSVVGEEQLEGLRVALGLPSRATESESELELFAPPRAPDGLPLVYRRLFSADTLEASDVLTGRDGEIARARRILSGERGGRLRSVALVGLDGVGKGAISGAIVRSRAWKQVRRLSFGAPVTREQVDEVFRDRTEGHLVVVDGLHWMISMRPQGFEPLRRFVEGVIADAGRNAWLVHADLLFWRYACQVAPLGDAFTGVLELDPLSPEALKAAVLARHALSGYGLSFESNDEDATDNWFTRAWKKVRSPYDAYFRDLHASSGGLVRDALRLWLASIRAVDDGNDVVRVGPVPRSSALAVRRLPEATLLQLYQVARQGWMCADVYAHVFRVDLTTAESQLAHLAHLGFLEESGGVYRIAVHLRGTVVRALREKGWVR